ncbi:MAG TPA: hypothetical protein VHZ07_15835 [Bryobacteraceae bacterium]|nr:hypothetical protein [Bryobacteraceae bacterium]
MPKFAGVDPPAVQQVVCMYWHKRQAGAKFVLLSICTTVSIPLLLKRPAWCWNVWYGYAARPMLNMPCAPRICYYMQEALALFCWTFVKRPHAS